MKLLIICMLLFSYIDASEVKDNVDIASIVANIDKISQALKVQEDELKKSNVKGFEDKELIQKREKEMQTWTQEIGYKQRKMEHVRATKEYEASLDAIEASDRPHLLRRIQKLSRIANGYLKFYRKKDYYEVPVDSYFQFSGNTYAYIDASVIGKISSQMASISQSISKLEGMKMLATQMKNFDSQTIMKNLDDIESRLIMLSYSSVDGGENVAFPPLANGTSSVSMLKVKKGDVFDGVYVASVDETKVVMKLKN